VTLSPFYEPVGGHRYRATESTGGPWNAAHQHAGPPAALLGRELERCAPQEGMALARIAFDILGPVHVGEVEVEASVIRPGRSVELLEARLRAGGRTAVVARAWRARVAQAPPAGADAPPPPRPLAATPLPPALDGFGYGTAVEIRFASGGWTDAGPASAWTRLRVPVVAGEEPTGLQRVLAVADSGNGVSGVLPLDSWMFINPELTVHLRREARGEWICLQAETTIAPGGPGLARSVLSDAEGIVAHGAQSLYVAPR
jgi:acyl-Coa thioesterase superfamily protein/acyl-CoA thioesterase superfamily protein